MRMTLWAALACGFVGWAGMAQAAKPPAKPQLVRFDFSATVQADGTLAGHPAGCGAGGKPAGDGPAPRGDLALHAPAMAGQAGGVAGVAVHQAGDRAGGGKQLRLPHPRGGQAGETRPDRTADGKNADVAAALPARADAQRRQCSAGVRGAVRRGGQAERGGTGVPRPGRPGVPAPGRGLARSDREVVGAAYLRGRADRLPRQRADHLPDGLPSGSLQAPPEVAALFDRYTDMCPEAKLETPVAGTFL